MAQKFIKIINKNEWQDLLNKVLFKTFFHNSDWEEFLEKQLKWLKFERYIYNNSALLSLARVGDKLISHPFCEYGGPLPLAEKIDGEAFSQDLFLEFRNPVRISFHPRLKLTGNVLVNSGRNTYFIEGQLALRKTTRHEIEKARANNIQLEPCQGQKDLKNFYNLHAKSAKRHKIPAYPISFFGYFLNSKEAEILLAKKDGRVIAGSVFLFYDRFVHYFQNAIDEKRKNLGANYLILWEKIQDSLAKNKVFDFGGTRVGSPLQIFKKGWGGKECPIFELTDQRFDLPGRLNLKILRSAFGFLPPFLIKKLSPYLLKYKL